MKNLKILTFLIIAFSLNAMPASSALRVATKTLIFTGLAGTSQFIQDKQVKHVYQASFDLSDSEEERRIKDILHKYRPANMPPNLIDKTEFRYLEEDHIGTIDTKTHPVMFVDPFKTERSKHAILHELGHIYNNDFYYRRLSVLSAYAAVCASNSRPEVKVPAALVAGVLSRHLFTRRAESRADQFAIDCLKSKKDTVALDAAAESFDNHAREMQTLIKTLPFTGGIISLLDPHPSSKSRADRFRQASEELKK